MRKAMQGVIYLKNDKQGTNERHTDPAIELAILNGIEAYNRSQRAKNAGETRSKEAMDN